MSVELLRAKVDRCKYIAAIDGVNWQTVARDLARHHTAIAHRFAVEDSKHRQVRRKAVAKMSARRLPRPLRRAVLASGRCTYCGDHAAHVDHVIPVSRGGTRRRANLRPACARCNTEKGDFTPAEWRAWRDEMGWPWPPPTLAGEVTRLLAEVAAA